MVFKYNKAAKNENSFAQMARAATYIGLLGFGMQAISAATEANGIFQFLSAVTDLKYIILGATIVVVIAREAGIRGTTQYISKMVIKWLSKRSTFHMADFAAVLVMLCIGLCLTVWSVKVSKENSHMTFIANGPEADTTSQKNIISEKTLALSDIEKDYNKRKVEITTRYLDLIKAEGEKYDSKKVLHNTEANYYRNLGMKRGKSYESTIKKHLNAIAKIEEEKTLALAGLKTKREKEYTTLLSWRSDQESGTNQFYSSAMGATKDKEAMTAEWFTKYAYIWSSFAGISVILSIVCMVFVEIFKFRSGIEESAIATASYYEPSIFSELTYWFSLYFITPIRNSLRNSINSMHDNRKELSLIKVTAPNIAVTEKALPDRVSVTGRGVTVTTKIGDGDKTVTTEAVTPPKTVTGTVTERVTAKRNPLLPTAVTPVTGGVFTDGALAKKVVPKTVTEKTGIIVEMKKPVTVSTPKLKPVEKAPVTVISVDSGYAIIDRNGKKERVTLETVKSRLRAQRGKKPKTDKGKNTQKIWVDFYTTLLHKMTKPENNV